MQNRWQFSHVIFDGCISNLQSRNLHSAINALRMVAQLDILKIFGHKVFLLATDLWQRPAAVEHLKALMGHASEVLPQGQSFALLT